MRIPIGLVAVLALAGAAAGIAVPPEVPLDPLLPEVVPDEVAAVVPAASAAAEPLRLHVVRIFTTIERIVVVEPPAPAADPAHSTTPLEEPRPFAPVATIAIDLHPYNAPRAVARPMPVRTDERPVEVASEPAGTSPFVAPATVATVAAAGLAAQALLAVGVAMYHRVAPSEALESRTRQAVHATVSERGSATAGEVAAVLGVDPKTARHHLDLLARLSLLVRDPDGAYRAPGVRRIAEATTEDRVAALVAERPGINMAEVGRELGISKSTAQDAVTKLLLSGRIESRRAERARLLFPPEAPGHAVPAPRLAAPAA